MGSGLTFLRGTVIPVAGLERHPFKIAAMTIFPYGRPRDRIPAVPTGAATPG